MLETANCLHFGQMDVPSSHVVIFTSTKAAETMILPQRTNEHPWNLIDLIIKCSLHFWSKNFKNPANSGFKHSRKQAPHKESTRIVKVCGTLLIFLPFNSLNALVSHWFSFLVCVSYVSIELVLPRSEWGTGLMVAVTCHLWRCSCNMAKPALFVALVNGDRRKGAGCVWFGAET